MAMAARGTAWKRQKADTQDSQLKRAVRRANTHVHRFCDAANARFLGKYVQGLKKNMCQRDERGLLQGIESLSMEDTPKFSSQYIRDGEGRMARDQDVSLEGGRDFWHPSQREI